MAAYKPKIDSNNFFVQNFVILCKNGPKQTQSEFLRVLSEVYTQNFSDFSIESLQHISFKLM